MYFEALSLLCVSQVQSSSAGDPDLLPTSIRHSSQTASTFGNLPEVPEGSSGLGTGDRTAAWVGRILRRVTSEKLCDDLPVLTSESLPPGGSAPNYPARYRPPAGQFFSKFN